MQTDTIHEALTALSGLITDKNQHMREVLNMLIGGLVIPAMVRENPDIIDENAEFKTLMQKYSRKYIENLLNGTGEVKEVEKIIEVKKVVEKIIQVNAAIKYRRIKSYGGSRKKKQKRILLPNDRDTIIRWLNKEQRLASPDDPIGEQLAEIINTGITDPDSMLAPYQVNGYISHLCRLGLLTDGARNEKLDRYMKRGDITIYPRYTVDFLKVIRDKWEASRQDEAEGAAERARIKASRAAA